MKRWDIAFRRKITAWCLRFPVYFSAFFTGFVAVLITSYILVRGIPNLKPELFSLVYNSENVSLLAPLVNSFLSALLALLIAVPAGVFSAVYLVEYSKKGSKLVKIVRLTSETLSGIPSIVYGLFGMLFFVTSLGLGMSLLSGVFTLAIMVLPLIMRTTEEALLAVPDSYREGSFGLGAGRLGTVIKIVLPAAVPGILSGELSARTLAVHLYVLSGEGQHMNESYAVAVVLLALVLVINTISYAVARKIRGGQGE